MYNDTVTIYTRSDIDDYEVTYIPNILPFTELQIKKGSNIKETGLENADVANLLINYVCKQNSIFINTSDGLKEYVGPKKYATLADKTGYITFTKNDFFVKGENVVKNASFDILNRCCDDCYKISNIDFYKTIPHFEIGGV